MHGQLILFTLIDRCPSLSPPATPLCSALVCFVDLSSVLGRFCVFASAALLGEREVSVGARMWPDVCV